MIVQRISGGLGNQLFQFSFAKIISDIVGGELVLDISFYENNFDHEGYVLDKIFECNPRLIYSRSQIKNFSFCEKYLPNRIFFSNWYSHKKDYIFSDSVLIDSLLDIYKKTNFLYMYGYWQNSSFLNRKYQKISDIFKFRKSFDLQPEILRYISDIKNSESVAIHLRRGDYLNKINKGIYAYCGDCYYNEAVRYVRLIKPNAKFYVFTDDYDAAIGLFSGIDGITFCSSGSSISDFYLMAHCKNNIIANSTYGWWAAYLNQVSTKIIVMPKVWFLTETHNSPNLYIPGAKLIDNSQHEKI